MEHELPVVRGLECCVLQLQDEGNGGKQVAREVIIGGAGRKIMTCRGVARFPEQAAGIGRQPILLLQNVISVTFCNRRGICEKQAETKEVVFLLIVDHNMKEERKYHQHFPWILKGPFYEVGELRRQQIKPLLPRDKA